MRQTESPADRVSLDATKGPPAEATSAPPAQVVEPAQPQPVAEHPAAPQPAAAPPAVDAKESPSADTDTALANSASYALNLPVSDVDSEIAKRKARAERFGNVATVADGEAGNASTGAADVEAQKTLERARRFGTGEAAIGKLDHALPAEAERGARKRVRTEEDSVMDDPALRRGFGGRGGRGGGRGGRSHGRGGGRDNSRRRTDDRPSGVGKASGAFSTDADRLAAEARRKKFAAVG